MSDEQKQTVSVQMSEDEVEALNAIMEQHGLKTKSDAMRKAVTDTAEEVVIPLEGIEEAAGTTWFDATQATPRVSSSGTEAVPPADLWKYRLLREKTAIIAGSISTYIAFITGRGYDVVMPKGTKCPEDLKEAILRESRTLLDKLRFQTQIAEYADIMLTEGFCPIEILKQNGLVYGWNFIGTDNFSILHDPFSLKPNQYKVNIEEGKVELFQPEDVMMLEWSKDAGQYFADSLLKSIMLTIEWFLNIEKAYAKGVYRYGNPIIIFIAKNWGKPQLKKFQGYLKKRSESGVGSLVVTGDVSVQEIRPSTELLSRRDALDHFIDQIAIGLGVPNVMYNVRSTSQESAIIQWQVFYERINDIRYHLNERIREFILKPHIDAMFSDIRLNEDELDVDEDGKYILPTPEIVWQNIQTSDPNKRIEQLTQMLRVEYVSPVTRIATEVELAEALNIDVWYVHENWDKYKEFYKGAIPPMLPAAQKEKSIKEEPQEVPEQFQEEKE